MPDIPPQVELISSDPYPGLNPSPVNNTTPRRGPPRVRIFTIVFALSGLLGLAYTFMRPAVFESSAILVMSATAAGEDPTQVNRVERVALQREVLNSRSLLTQVLENLSHVTGPRNGLPRTVGELHDMLSVTPVGDAGILELRAEGPQPAALPLVVNTWVDAYLAAQASTRKTASESNDAAYRQQGAALERKVAVKREQLEEFRRQYDIVSMERDENRAAAKLRGLTEALNKANEQEVTAEARLQAMREAVASGETVVRIDDERTLANLEQRAVALREQMQDFEQRYTPAYMALDANIKAAKRNLERVEQEIELKRRQAQQAALSEAEQALGSAREAAANLRRQMEEYKQTVSVFTARFAEHEALQQDLLELEQLNREVQQRVVQTEIMDEHQLPRLEVLERAFVPERPVRPLFLRDAGISLGAAFVLGLFAVWFYEFVGRREGHTATTELPPFFYRVIQRSRPVTELPAEQPMPALDYLPARELAESETALLLNTEDAATRVLIMTLLGGLSVEQAARLQWEDVDVNAGQLHIGGPGARTVPLPLRLGDSLADFKPRESTADMPIWVDADGKALKVADLDAMIETAAYDAGLNRPTEVTGQALLHTYLAFLVRQGVRLTDLSRIVGRPIPPTELVTYGRLSPPGPGLPVEQVERVYPLLR